VQVIGLILGIIAVITMFIAFIPFLGWMNWLNIPFAILGLVFSLLGVAASRGNKSIGISGIVLSIIAIFFGILKLKACGGFI
jgi:hypothetical protein